MKAILKYSALSLLASSMTSSVMAQNLNAAYFLDGFTYRHEMNPAYDGDTYFSIPVLGNMNLGVNSNMELDNYIYKTSDLPGYQGTYKLTTFMDPAVSNEQFLKNCPENNLITSNVDLTVFSLSFSAFHGYNTLSIKSRTQYQMDMPRELLEFAKMGLSGNDHYSMNDFGAEAASYIEVALGHSHAIGEGLRIGAKAKVLIGGGYANAKVTNMDIRRANNAWLVKAQTDMDVAYKGVIAETDEDGYLNGFDADSPGLGGLGLGCDLGISYTLKDGPLRGLELSAALLDVGFIKWDENIHAKSESSTYRFDGFQNVSIDGEETCMEDQWDNMKDDLEKLAHLVPEKETTTNTTKLKPMLNAGVSYKLPCYDRLSFGVLYSHKLDEIYDWSEARFSANIYPSKWFGASVSYACGSYGSNMGMVLNFHPAGINFFIAANRIGLKYTKDYIPMSACADVAVGFNIKLSSAKN